MPVEHFSLSAEDILNQLVVRVRFLTGKGVKSGDCIFIGHGNCIDFFIDLLACWSVGGCIVPLNTKQTPYELRKLVRAVRPRFFLYPRELDLGYKKILDKEDVTIVESVNHAIGCVSTVEREKALLQVNKAKGDALILFTSGSTGEPKGVVHTHASLREKWRALSEEIAPETLRRSLCLLPTHFGHGLICNALFPWLSGNALFLLPLFSPTSLMTLGDLLTRHKITFFSSVPAIWQLVLKMPRPKESNLLEVFCGSATLSRNLWEEVSEWCSGAKVRNVYGITETGSWIAGSSGGAVADGLVGYPWGSRFEIMPGGSIENCPSQNSPCKVGQTGHVWVKTDALMKGYLNRDDWTAEKVSDGWFSTGDIGLIDAQGQLFLKGRERDEINRGGIKIYPAEVESVVSSYPAVVEACSFACDDRLYGQAVGVALVVENNNLSDLKHLHAWTCERLADHKVPKFWFLVECIPKTDRGKINRNEVAHYCSSREPLDIKQILRAAK